MAQVMDQTIGENFALYQGDCVDLVRGMPDESIGYSIFSPPFASLYTYSASPRDMGNCRDNEEFFAHFAFLATELYRVMKPGRLVSMHCMLLPTSKSRDGFIGLRDFRGDLIRAMQAVGFVFHSEVVIWKDPVTAMQRTKALGLLHKTIRKDSSMSRQAISDYVVTLRKPTQNVEPIGHEEKGKGLLSDVEVWQRYASPVWVTTRGVDDEGFAICRGDTDPRDDTSTIDPSDTLQYRSAREHDDERHICLGVGSLVLTREHGYIEIESVEPGDHVLTHRGRWKRVLAKKCNGVAGVVRVSAQGVPGLTLTPDHRVWTKVPRDASHAKKSAKHAEPRWVEASSTLGSYLNLPLAPEEPSELTDHEWWIVGRWLGDGHRSVFRTSGKRGGAGHFVVSCGHHESEELRGILGQHAGHVSDTGTATQIALVGLRDEVRDVLSRCGEGASNKRLPAEAFTLDAQKSDALLRGYLSADGHYVERYDRVCASSISRALLLGVAMLAQRARGVVASVYPGRPAREGEIQGRLVKMSQDWILSFRDSDGVAKSGWIDGSGAWKKVRKIEDAGQEEVWDIQVEDDESFVAEGAVVHNCPLQLGVIRRCLRLWSNPGDVVLSPFAGIGSEGYVSLEEKRRFVGCELKRSYYEQAARNLASVDAGSDQLGLFG